jgi:translation initiation factor IF-2
VFKVGTQREVKKGLLETKSFSDASQRPKENAINVVVKADGVSSQEAVVDAISKLSSKLEQPLHVVQAGVGAINESDVTLASDTGARIYGLHTKVDSRAGLLAQKLGVAVSVFNIIYRLLEDLEAVSISATPAKIITKKVGEAYVLKVFNIKKLGVAAGFRVDFGHIARDGYLVMWRGKNRTGEGEVISLQQDRKTVKEVKKGFEGALMVADFENWQEDDRIECYCDVAEA